jgi:hypothetical protein
MTWNFFGTRQGKREWDRVGVVVKQALRNEQIHNPMRRLQNEKNCVPSSYESSRRTISRIFWNVKLEHIDRSNFYACDNILGFSKFHYIHVFSIFDPTKLIVRPLACFCISCFERDWQHCLNQSHVPEWKIIKLCPKDTQFVRGNMEEDEEVGLEGL